MQRVIYTWCVPYMIYYIILQFTMFDNLKYVTGSMEFELSRIEDYLEKPEGYCDDSVDIPVLRGTPISLCTNTDRYMLRNPCKIILIG